MNSLNIHKGDVVIVLSGKDKGSKGKVISTFPTEGKVLVEGINLATKHRKARRATEVAGIQHKESPIYVCKVMHVCNKCGKPTRASYSITGEGKEAKKTRRCTHCKEAI